MVHVGRGGVGDVNDKVGGDVDKVGGNVDKVGGNVDVHVGAKGVVGEVVQGMDVLNAIAALPTVKDNSASPFFAVAKTIGDKRATVAEQAFGKPFAKVTVAKCGVVKRETPPAGDVDIAAPPA